MSDPRIKLKRSAVSGKIPSANDLPLGELALNTYDGRLYASKNAGIGTTVFAINPWAVGLGSDTYNTFFTSGSVGIGTTNATSKLTVVGDVNIVGISTFTGNVTLSNIVLNGSVSTGGTTGTSGQYLKSVGTGITWASFPTLRTGNVFTAGVAQTSFAVSYNVGFVDVYINGVRLTDSEFTGTSGTSIVLNESCFGGETVDILAYNTTSTGSGGGGGISTESQTLNGVLGLGNTSSNGMSVGVITATSFVGNLTGTATFATTAGIATYASNAGIATYATTAGIATYASNAGIATYATTAGIATYASNAGIATYATTAGIATNAQGLTGTPNISVGIITSTDSRIQSVAEKTTLVNGNTVSLVYNTGGGNVAICTNPSGNITLNVTGIPTDSTFDNYSLAFSVIVSNTGTARSCTAINLNGLSRTIKWFGGSLAAAISGVTTSNGYDSYSFTGINTVGSASTTANYIVLGSVNGSYR